MNGLYNDLLHEIMKLCTNKELSSLYDTSYYIRSNVNIFIKRYDKRFIVAHYNVHYLKNKIDKYEKNIKFDNVVKCNNISCIKYLNKKRHFRFTLDTFNIAIKNENLKLIKWLVKNKCCFSGAFAKNIIKTKNIKMILWLNNTGHDIILDAIELNDFELIKWLYTKKFNLNVLHLNKALNLGQFDMGKWIYSKINCINQDTFLDVCSSYSLPIIEWLKRISCEKCKGKTSSCPHFLNDLDRPENKNCNCFSLNHKPYCNKIKNWSNDLFVKLILIRIGHSQNQSQQLNIIKWLYKFKRHIKLNLEQIKEIERSRYALNYSVLAWIKHEKSLNKYFEQENIDITYYDNGY
jgi:hypothetical protein